MTKYCKHNAHILNHNSRRNSRCRLEEFEVDRTNNIGEATCADVPLFFRLYVNNITFYINMCSIYYIQTLYV